jgi:hypothetical protein
VFTQCHYLTTVNLRWPPYNAQVLLQAFAANPSNVLETLHLPSGPTEEEIRAIIASLPNLHTLYLFNQLPFATIRQLRESIGRVDFRLYGPYGSPPKRTRKENEQ